MESIKKSLTSKVMKVVGSVSLFLGALVIVPTSTLSSHQPKCPDEFLK
ncbi:AgrD family cyclic lactone autoinducer peptide [Clostridium arbusti]|nr:cyclic lactone autoinducer peptide [Clostridium arbusti]